MARIKGFEISRRRRVTRESIWSVSDRALFNVIALTHFIFQISRLSISRPINIQDITDIGIFSVVISFFTMEALDMVGALTETVRKWQFKRGREKGRVEAEEKYIRWIREEESKGTVFNSPPPSENTKQD